MSEGHDRGGATRPICVRDVMTTAVVSVAPTATVKEIAEAMLAHDVRSVPVVDIGERLVGVVSEADLISRERSEPVEGRYLAKVVAAEPGELEHHWAERARGLTAGEVMTAGVITCGPGEPVAVAARAMLRHDVRTLPVLEGDRLVGVVSRHDLLRLLDRPDPEIRERLAALLAEQAPGPGEARVSAAVRDGVVVLTGPVRDPGEAERTVAAARHVPGVVEVVDRLHVEGGRP